MTVKTATSDTVQVNINVEIKRLVDLLVGAFEGGSNYWYTIVKVRKPTKVVHPYDPEIKYKIYDALMNDGSVVIRDLLATDEGDGTPAKKGHDSNDYILNRAAMEKGLRLMSEKAVMHFNDFMAEKDDACTADVYLQMCLFEEIVYG